ncbi:ABC transporter substrate-binding protein [Ensifer adhaerens]|uniref:ABC transporter substrate-binding protein n=1 Tax=Ensifer adhaerens TaxID=106592 RepID=UPI000DC21396|nr:ABC transporter substrate-binding protein [Ensifer adhaerens]RAS07098.1 putative spermidine/putrescine transport system substrate-binding protein [Ensifer adhaerens]
MIDQRLTKTTALALLAFVMQQNSASAETKTLYIGMNGGNFERAYTEHVLPPFEKANDVKVVVVPGTSADILAKATAAKDNPQMHVMLLDDGVMVRAIGGGLCQKIAADPVLDQIQMAARQKDDMAIGVDMGMTGLAYNKKLFDEKGWPAPTSWMDMADPKFENAVVFQSASASSFGLHAFLMFNRIQGGDETNVEPGFDKFSDTIGKNVIEFIPSSAKISEMVQTGEAAIFPLTPTAVNNLKDKGIPVEYAQPKEGSVVLAVTECVIANNSEPELSQKLAHYLLSAEAQSLALDHGNIIPSNVNAKAGTDAANAKLSTFKANMETAKVLDWDAINQNRQEWNKRWNRMIER